MPPQFELKAKERIRKGLLVYREILQHALARGVTEEDTSTIVQSILVEVLGYDRFQEISGQYAVKGRWADWAVKVNDATLFFVEVKPVGTKLRERDLFQIVGYSRQQELEWTVLTTGDVWECFRVATGHEPEEFLEIRLLDASQDEAEIIEHLYLLSKEGFTKGALQEHWGKDECFRPERLAAVLLSDDVLGTIRRVVHRENPGRRIEVDDLREALLRGVIRGDLRDINGVPAAAPAKSDIPKRQRKASRPEPPVPPEE